ncbi:response regulator [Salinispirillum sp. LH 10-3-1]|uniref:histidine kinase n=1 Tax=Salinispirillum sp. LH 10-3-1 TaxID=2952525 RepID=A0AB38YI94_9GAMM
MFKLSLSNLLVLSFIVLLGSLALPSLATALPADVRSLNLLPDARFMVDSRGRHDISQMAHPEIQNQMVPVRTERLQRNVGKGVLWLQLTLENTNRPAAMEGILLLSSETSLDLEVWHNGQDASTVLTPTLRGYALPFHLAPDGGSQWIFRIRSNSPLDIGLAYETLGTFTSRDQWLSFYIYALLGAGLLAAIVLFARQTARRHEHNASIHFLLWPSYLFTLVLFTLFQYVGLAPLTGQLFFQADWLPGVFLAIGASLMGLMWWGPLLANQDRLWLSYLLSAATVLLALIGGTAWVIGAIIVLCLVRLSGIGIRRAEVHQFPTVAAILSILLWGLLELLRSTDLAITGTLHRPIQLTLLMIHGVYIQRSFLARVKQRPVFTNLMLPTDATKDSLGLLRKLNHDLRSPINGVLGMASLLSETQLNSQQQDYVATINNAGLQMLNLADEMRTLTRLSTGQLRVRPKRVELNVFLHEVVSPFARLASQKMIEVATQILPNVPRYVRIDPDAVAQVLRLLLDNAVKYTEEGDILVTIRLEGDDRLRIRVDDSGRGVPEEEQTGLFDFQPPVTDPEAGRSYIKLGLPIARAIVHAMSGQIGMSRPAEQGSTFWLSIPFVADQQPETNPALASMESLLQKKVLIVDDHFACRRVLEDQTRSWGMQPELASDGKEALAILQSHMYFHQPFDWVFIDYRMPRMDGLELLRKVRAISGLRRLKVVMMTGVDQNYVEQAVGELDTVAVLPKPINTRELMRLLVS